MTDKYYMSEALKLSEKHVGLVAPNPSVGCVIVKFNGIIGKGVTAPGGRPHGETEAIKSCKISPTDSTMYVTLEPCCHQGLTGPCTREIVKARIKRVVVATVDPDPRVAGGGVQAMREAGIEVVVGVLREEAEAINVGFFTTRTLLRPWITCKIATSLDGKIAASSGDSKWITEDDTRAWVHELRAKYDAIMIGSNTLVTDNPLLTCRIPGLEDKSPIRLIVDSQERLEERHKIPKTADKIKTYIITNNEVEKNVNDVNYLIVASNSVGKVCLQDTMRKLVSVVGVTRVLVEGGGTLITELLKENLIDKLIICRSGKILGNDSIPFVGDLGLSAVSECYRFKKNEIKEFLNDVVEMWDVVRK